MRGASSIFLSSERKQRTYKIQKENKELSELKTKTKQLRRFVSWWFVICSCTSKSAPDGTAFPEFGATVSGKKNLPLAVQQAELFSEKTMALSPKRSRRLERHDTY